MVTSAMTKPQMRGVLHAWAAPVAAVIGLLMLIEAKDGRAQAATAVWAASLTGLFAVSATYHRGDWQPRAKELLQRIDHSMIFVLIAGSYTPICLLVLNGNKSWLLLAVVWGGALVGVATRLLWRSAPRWLFVPMYLALGWVAVAVLPDLAASAPLAANILLVVGGLLYTIGALVFATQWPDPNPLVFGFHEVFHLLTLLAAACHAVAIGLVALG